MFENVWESDLKEVEPILTICVGLSKKRFVFESFIPKFSSSTVNFSERNIYIYIYIFDRTVKGILCLCL